MVVDRHLFHESIIGEKLPAIEDLDWNSLRYAWAKWNILTHFISILGHQSRYIIGSGPRCIIYRPYLDIWSRTLRDTE